MQANNDYKANTPSSSEMQATPNQTIKEETSDGIAATLVEVPIRKSRPWSVEEDLLLKRAVIQKGPSRWTAVIAPLVPGRTGKQCHERWKLYLDPTINRSPFTIAEKRILVEAVAREGTKWSEISKLLPGRSKSQIKNVYYAFLRKKHKVSENVFSEEGNENGVRTSSSKISACMKRAFVEVARKGSIGDWTPKESTRLIKHVLHNRQGSIIPWQSISRLFENKTAEQCKQHWECVLKFQLTKGRGTWTDEEDEKLSLLVRQLGSKSWKEVAKQLPGRIGKQCRERWINFLDPSLKKTSWTVREKEQLLRLHQEYGGKWSKIAKCIPGRSDNSCKNCWNSMQHRTKFIKVASTKNKDNAQR